MSTAKLVAVLVASVALFAWVEARTTAVDQNETVAEPPQPQLPSVDDDDDDVQDHGEQLKEMEERIQRLEVRLPRMLSDLHGTLHSKNCGDNITPPVLIEDLTMHFTSVLNLWC